MKSDNTIAPLVDVQELAKKFCKDMRWSMWYGLQDMVSKGSPDLRRHEFWALTGINLQILRGQSVGLVGRNGSGKTTLMRMLCQLMPPTKGRLTVDGKVTPIFRLRSGMHPHYTGRDYIYIQGAMHGMSRARIDEKFTAIVDFAELHGFIDSPVGTYSSGMKARLGYSIAIASDFDLLIIDEALAVGDTDFRKKCLDNLSVISKDKALLFVSHNLDMVEQVSNTLVVMDKGRIVNHTFDVTEGLAQYSRQKPAGDKAPTVIIPQAKQVPGNLPDKPINHPLSLVSLHIPKTAGTSFRQVLQSVYGDQLCKVDIRNDQLFINNKLFVGDKLPSATNVIHGHFYYQQLSKAIALPADIRVVTWLRDPVERVISNYYYLSRRLAEELQEEQKGLNIRMKMQRSLLEFAASPFARNRMSKFLAGVTLEELFFVGIVEEYAADMARLRDRLRWPPVEIAIENSTGAARLEVDADTRAKIAALNTEDIALYEHALALRKASLAQ